MYKLSQRILFMLTVDAILVIVAMTFALLFRFDGTVPTTCLFALAYLLPLIIIINLGFLLKFKLYGRVWEYASWGELFSIIKATTCSYTFSVAIIEVFRLPGLPRSVYVLGWLFTIVLIIISRLWWKANRDYFHQRGQQGARVLIVGAGNAGAVLCKEIQSNPQLGMKAVAFVDDSPKKQGRIMLGLPIMGTRYDIPELVKNLNIEEIIIAMPSIKGPPMRGIINICEDTSARLKIIPHVYQNSEGSLLSKIRKVNMEDLLSRHPVQIDLQQVSGYLQNKTVLVTGGGGSIGSELCRQILKFHPHQLVIIDSSENSLFEIEMELKAAGWLNLDAKLVDIKQRDALEAVFQEFRPQVVFHAAAFKHVPMMERHPEAAIHNNVLGTHIVASLADKYHAETFIQNSTDKAVNPTSVMGASKRLAELIIKDLSRKSKTTFATVRFGNVLGSRGSVIPTFEKQIEAGGPITVTHPDMTRYFMTIPEAVELVIQAGAMAKGGEIFVLDMGEPVKIVDLACDLIRLYGLEPWKDIDIVFTGMRPGEKLFEELFSNAEDMGSTYNERIYISHKEIDQEYVDINANIEGWVRETYNNREAILRLIANLIPEYRNSEYQKNRPAKVILIRASNI